MSHNTSESDDGSGLSQTRGPNRIPAELPGGGEGERGTVFVELFHLHRREQLKERFLADQTSSTNREEPGIRS